MNDKYNDNRPKFTSNPNEQFWWYRGLEVSEEDIRRSMENATNCGDAAAFLGISYASFRKYASRYKDHLTGKTLFEIQKEKHISAKKDVVQIKSKVRRNWNKLLKENQKPTKQRIVRLKSILIEKEKLKDKCNRCGFNHKRQEDSKAPLMLYFKNGNKRDWRLDNLELVCYNCAFLYNLDFFKDSMLSTIESTPLDSEAYKKELQEFTQLDDFYMDYMKELGVNLDETTPESFIPKTSIEDIGNEFIDRL